MDAKNVIVVTGASGGVGSMLALGLAQKGNHVVCLGRNQKALSTLVEKINKLTLPMNGSASFWVLDMMDPNAVKRIGQAIFDELTKIDVWINNVGVNDHNALGPTWELTPENWLNETNQNIYPTLNGTVTAINLMKKKNAGYIINMGGGGVQYAKPFASAYGSAKTAIVKFTETISMELVQMGLDINVFAFNPGFIRNTRTELLVKSDECKKFMPNLVDAFEQGQLSNIEDSIYLLNVLISGHADKLTGCYFQADDKNIDDVIKKASEHVEQKTYLLHLKQ